MDRPTKGRIRGSLWLGDRRLMHFIYSRIRCRLLDFLMPYITHLGGAKFTIATAVAVFIAIDYQLGLELGLSLAVSHLLVHVIKRIANRPRPYITLKGIKEVKIPFEPYSFPSGHTTASFALAVTVSLHLPIFNFILLPLAALVGISRIYLGVHYPSDIFIGGLLGTFFSYLIHITIFS